jgi:acyl carrier protein
VSASDDRETRSAEEISAAVLAGIAAVAREHLGHEGPLPLEARLVEDLELDSIRLLTLATEVENHFRVLLLPEDEGRIETVGDLVAVVRAKLAQPSSGRRAPGAPR